jgi:signal recognition particle receptor subunit beta
LELNQRDHTVRLKLVYYGPALCGKTTNLKVLHEQALWSRRGEFVSLNSQQDRTILCDLLPLKTGGFRGYDLKLQLLAVPGQTVYYTTRRVVLKGADGIVFVANSAADRWQENVQSLKELTANLMVHQLDPASVPIVFQYNKRDLPAVMGIEELSRALNTRKAPEFGAVATSGEGVLETFAAIIARTVDSLSRRYKTLELPPGQTVDGWAKQAVQGMFGKGRLDEEPMEAEVIQIVEEEPPVSQEHREVRSSHVSPLPPVPTVAPRQPSEDRRLVRVAMPEEEAPRGGPATTEVRSSESLAESYAEVSAELSQAVSDLREERDQARVRLEQVRHALELATEAPGTTAVEQRIQRILRVLGKAAGASGATLLLTTSDPPRVIALPPLTQDPLTRTAWGSSHVETLRSLAEPRIEEATESPQLRDALRSGKPSFEAVAAVPLRSAERLLGLALLYFQTHTVLPSRETLLHLGFLARVLGGPLEASAARDAASGVERLRVVSRASSTAVASLLTRMPVEATRRQALRLTDALGPLRAPGVTVDVSPDTLEVRGDAALLRFAVATLLHQCETDAIERGLSPLVKVRAAQSRADSTVLIQVSGGGGRQTVALPHSSLPDLADAELGVVQAIVAQHGGRLVSGRSESQDPQFTLVLPG